MDRVAEIKDMIYDKAMEKKAFYNKVGMKAGRFKSKREGMAFADDYGCMPKSASENIPVNESNRVYKAWKSVDKINATEGEKVKLRQQILARARELKINTKGWSNK